MDEGRLFVFSLLDRPWQVLHKGRWMTIKGAWPRSRVLLLKQWDRYPRSTKRISCYTKARFTLAELTARVHGPSWPAGHVDERPVSTSRVDGPCWRVMQLTNGRRFNIKYWALNGVHHSHRPLDRPFWPCNLDLWPFDLILIGGRGNVMDCLCAKF